MTYADPTPISDVLDALQGAQRLLLDMGKIIRGLDGNSDWPVFWTLTGDTFRGDSRFDAIESVIRKALGSVPACRADTTGPRRQCRAGFDSLAAAV
jgi:hypothetical protein